MGVYRKNSLLESLLHALHELENFKTRNSLKKPLNFLKLGQQ